MSNFLVIAPEDYIRVDSDEIMGKTGVSLNQFEGMTSELMERVNAAQVAPEGKYVVEFILLDGGLWAKFADITE